MLLDNDRNRLRYMVEAALEIRDHVHDCRREDLLVNHPLGHLLLWNLLVFGEAASRVSAELRAAHPEIPWRDITDMRNRLVHAYFDVNMDIIWRTVQYDLPATVTQLQVVLEEG